MKQYADLLREIFINGDKGSPARDNMPTTRYVIDREIRVSSGKLPILMGKKVLFGKVLSELLWFLKGETNINFLHKYDNHIWDQDAFNFYKKIGGALSSIDWLLAVKLGQSNYPKEHLTLPNGDVYTYGDCGRIYGHQWRHYGQDNLSNDPVDGEFVTREGVDQIANLINSLKTNPYGRYHIVDAWNPQDMMEGFQALPACHTGFMCAVRRGVDGPLLDLSVNQRSCDMFLGVPYNLLSYGILQRILCELTGMRVGNFVWHGFNCHIYDNQEDAVAEYLSRMLPENNVELHIDSSSWGSVDMIEMHHFTLVNYDPLPFIRATLSTGMVE